jgi:hypothetical protein
VLREAAVTGPNLSGDDCPDLMGARDEAWREAVEDRVRWIKDRCDQDVLKASIWLYTNARDGHEVDTAAARVLMLELKAAGSDIGLPSAKGLLPVFRQWQVGETTPSDPAFLAIKARYERRRVRADGFHILGIDMEPWELTAQAVADDDQREAA